MKKRGEHEKGTKAHDYRVALFGAIAGSLSAALLGFFLLGDTSKSDVTSDDFEASSAQYASGIVDFTLGNPASIRTERVPHNLLSAPDYLSKGDGKAFTLGCKGSVVVDFGDYNIFNEEGYDLVVNEVGEDVEKFTIWLSTDNRSWQPVQGSFDRNQDIEFGELDPENGFRFVKITESDPKCKKGDWPGADIDSVLALHARKR